MRYLPVLVATTLALGACTKSQPSGAQPPAAVTAAAHDTAAAPGGAEVTGKVVETMNSGGYTYVHLETSAQGEKWAAVPQTAVKVGETVTVVNAMVMPSFKSSTLNRTFENILFGTLGSPTKAPALNPTDAATAAAAHPQTRSEAVEIGKPIARAPGAEGHTVAELFAQGAQLAGKRVAVRGKVAKVNANIQGRNWVHLQDGTGQEQSGDHDVVVTTAQEAQVGDVVLARGVLAADKDVGGGYHYKVLIEDGTLEK